MRPDELAEQLGQGSINVVECTGVKVNPLTRRMWLSPSLSVNYMVLARRMGV